MGLMGFSTVTGLATGLRAWSGGGGEERRRLVGKTEAKKALEMAMPNATNETVVMISTIVTWCGCVMPNTAHRGSITS